MIDFLTWCRDELPKELSDLWHYGAVPMRAAFIAAGMFFTTGAIAGAAVVIWFLR